MPSSVNLLFLMGSSPLGEGHSLNLSLVRKFQAGQYGDASADLGRSRATS